MSEQEKKKENKKEWYQTCWGITIAILFLPIFIVWYVWAKSKLSQVWKIVITVIIGIMFISALTNEPKPTTTTTKPSATTTKTLTPEEQAKKAEADALAKKKADEEKAKAEANAKAQKEAEDKAKNVPAEYKSALSQAGSYAKIMNMSKQGVYDQLVSEYGGKFSAEAAQYAIDNVKADWGANALAKAKTYQDTMHLSPSAIHDQLTSQYGEKFTQAEADYAIQHLND